MAKFGIAPGLGPGDFAGSNPVTRTNALWSFAPEGVFFVYSGADLEGDADFLRVLAICCRYAYNKKINIFTTRYYSQERSVY